MGKRRGFGRIRKLPSGRYQASYIGPDTKRHNAPSTFETAMDAEHWLGNRRNEIIDGEWTPGRARRKTVILEPFARQWVAERRRKDGSPLRPRTKAHYTTLLDRFICPSLGHLPIRAITDEVVEIWYNGLDTGPTYQAHAYSLLRTILKTAVERGLMQTNPCHIRGAGNAETVKQVEPATLDELATIVETVPGKYKMMHLLAAWCQLRYGELIALDRTHFDRKNGVLKIRRGVTWVDGKAIVGPPKTKAGKRDVHVPPHLLPMLTQHVKKYAGPGRAGLLFPPTGDGEFIRPSTLYRVFYRAREAVGRPDLDFHDLRHTGATYAAREGATLAELMLRLGHSTSSAAMRYQHAARDRDKEIAKRLSQLADGPARDARKRGESQGNIA